MNTISFLFSVYDRAAESFAPPFLCPHNGIAIRGFQDAINDNRRESDISKHPDDFDLYVVGQFDSSTGRIEPIKPEKPIVLGKQLAIGRSPNTDLLPFGNSATMRDSEPNSSPILDPNFKLPA